MTIPRATNLTPAVIDSFRGRYSFLSNFYRVPVMYEGVLYPTLEHAYQAARTTDPTWRTKILFARTPGGAKRLGRDAKEHGAERRDWYKVNLAIMLDLLRIKFSREDLAFELQQTGDAELVEGNEWGDQFWGVCYGHGENHLGKLLMKVRGELNKRK